VQFSNWLIFCGVALLVTFTPGPGVLLAVSNSVAVGPRRTVISSLGNATGLYVLSGVAMAGMGVVLATSAAAFTMLKVAGALYLIYLGVKQWRSHAGAFPRAASVAGIPQPRAPWRLFAQGLTVALTNPKAILFFTALYPQFVTPSAPVLGQFAVLTTTFTAFAMLSHAFYVVLARVLKRQLASSRAMQLFNYATGGLFVVLGLGLLRLRQKAA
jgi:homoserine/homoserine lactone efflux protein